MIFHFYPFFFYQVFKSRKLFQIIFPCRTQYIASTAKIVILAWKRRDVLCLLLKLLYEFATVSGRRDVSRLYGAKIIATTISG